MNFSIQEHIPANFSPASRVWIYQSSRLFSISEAIEIEGMMNDFVAGWHSHGDKVKGYANLFFGQFVIIMADESQSGVSGCSTDSSVRLIKSIEQQFNVDMFNRQNMAFLINERIQLLPLAQLNYAFQNGFISMETTYFNNLVLSKQELENKWMIPVKDSWLVKKLTPAQSA